jgi:putative ABC transport system ATP-binding protein
MPFSRINKKDKEFFKEKLSLLNMGLEDRLKQPVGLLSGGQRQALTLLMATMVTPKLLLLDEHTAALDPATADKVLELTKKIVEENKITCLMITHNMQQALDLGNRTLMMSAGNIVLDIKGEERAGMTVNDLLTKFRVGTGYNLDNDRILLSE